MRFNLANTFEPLQHGGAVIPLIRTILIALMTSMLTGCTGASRAVGHPSEAALSASGEAIDLAGEEQRQTIERTQDNRTINYTRSDWQYVGFDGTKFTTPHFHIFTTARRADFLDRLPMFFESALDHYTSHFCDLPRPQRPLETYLFQDRRQWQVKTQELLPRQAESFTMLGRGGFATRGIAVLYYIDWSSRAGSRDTFAIAAHEGWHQYTQSTFEHPLPIWLEEGIATYMESLRVDREGHVDFRPGRNRERRLALRRAVHSDALIPLHELLHHSPQRFLESGRDRLLVYYAQVWALTHFLVQGEDGKYRPALNEVLMDAAEGRLVERVMSKIGVSMSQRRMASRLTRNGPVLITAYFNDDLDAFEQEYLDYVYSLTGR